MLVRSNLSQSRQEGENVDLQVSIDFYKSSWGNNLLWNQKDKSFGHIIRKWIFDNFICLLHADKAKYSMDNFSHLKTLSNTALLSWFSNIKRKYSRSSICTVKVKIENKNYYLSMPKFWQCSITVFCKSAMVSAMVTL